MGAEERAAQVDGHHLVEVGLGGVQQRSAGLDTGVVDQHIQAPVSVHRGLHHALQIRSLGDVGLHPDRVPTGSFHLRDQRCGLLRVGDVINHHVRALSGGRQDNGLANAAVTAGDDNRFALQHHENSPGG